MKIEKSKIKIALVQDYVKEFGGAESVLETLSDIFPDAPIYTSLYCPKFFGPHRSRLEKKWNHRIKQSFFQYVPFAYKIISPLRLLSPLAFKSFDFSGYDLIISSATGAYFPNSLNKGKAKLISYCHTPPRYLYGLPTARNFTKNRIIRFFVNIINHYLRILDFKYSQNVDQFIANSQTTAARIKKFYRRDSIVINPPIELPKKSFVKHNISGTESCERSETRRYRQILCEQKQYLLTGGRLARAKRYDIAIKACNQLGLNLKIFGRDFAGFEAELKNIAGPTITFLGEVTQEQKAALYSNAKAFIFCSDNEDFGIVPVESMSYGCPVVAYKSGGVTETVIDGKTGIFFNRLNSKSCQKALLKLKNLKITANDCINQAQNFNSEKFVEKIKENILTK